MQKVDNLPKHVAIIMDGNGRWARQKGLPRLAGHRAGIQRVREIIQAAQELGIEILTLFAFSHENWQRPKKEVNMLMKYLESFIKKNMSNLVKNNIVLKIIGRERPLPKEIVSLLKEAVEKTKYNTGLILCLALNYGARQEVLDAAKHIAALAREKKIHPNQLNEEKFAQFLYTAGLPDPDLLVRTSGEQRISNFLLWQISYTELYFSKKYWPDFAKSDFLKAVEEFRRRQRRFGNI